MKNFILFLILLSSSPLFSQFSLEGIWNTGEENTKIEIIQTNNKWNGRIKSSENKSAQIGQIILKDLKKEGKKWTGKIYSFKRKEWYEVEIFPSNSILRLEIKVGFLSKTIKWTNK
jgi:uncharacterized protein (DUF2147 family)